MTCFHYMLLFRLLLFSLSVSLHGCLSLYCGWWRIWSNNKGNEGMRCKNSFEASHLANSLPSQAIFVGIRPTIPRPKGLSTVQNHYFQYFHWWQIAPATVILVAFTKRGTHFGWFLLQSENWGFSRRFSSGYFNGSQRLTENGGKGPEVPHTTLAAHPFATTR